MTMHWYGPQAREHVRDQAARRIERAARGLRDYIRERLGVGHSGRFKGTPVPGATLGASDAGDYPRMVTGHLRRNVQMEMDRSELRARVGTNVLYGKFLELGTRKMARRPWMSRALAEFGPQLRRILREPA